MQSLSHGGQMCKIKADKIIPEALDTIKKSPTTVGSDSGKEQSLEVSEKQMKKTKLLVNSYNNNGGGTEDRNHILLLLHGKTYCTIS